MNIFILKRGKNKLKTKRKTVPGIDRYIMLLTAIQNVNCP